MNKTEINKDISLLIKDLNYLRQNPRLTTEQLLEIKVQLSEILKIQSSCS